MGGIGCIVCWDGAPVGPDQGERLLGPIRHRGPDGLFWEEQGPVGLGWAALLERRPRGPFPPPIWSADRSLAAVADARLFNRQALSRILLPDRPDPAPAELILAAYRRWGEALVERLEGDFAFVLWDGSRRRLQAARDPFGVRPLFFHNDRRRLILASEPKQILTLPGVAVEPDDLVVGEYLLGRFEEIDHTFWRGVRRVRPAHALVAAEGEVVSRRYWNPAPAAERDLSAPHLERFRDELRRGVARRLESDFPVALHLSGGLDSSSLVVTAAQALEGATSPPAVTTVSCVFPGLPCDESAFIHEVERGTPFAHLRRNPLERELADHLEEDFWRLDSPYADLQRTQFETLAAALREIGARTVLTGIGGDELLHEESYLRDLARRGRLPRLLTEAWRAGSYSHFSSLWLLTDALKELVPRPLRWLRGRLRRRRWRPPDWAEPELVRSFLRSPEPPPPPRGGFPSLTQESAYRYLAYPELCWSLEALEARGAHHGFSPTHPYLDRALAERVLAIPLEARLPRGRWKHLLREGLAGDLPAAVRERRRKTHFDAFDRHLLRSSSESLRRLLFDRREWRSGAYVRRQAAAGLFDLGGADPSPARLHQLWRVATVELWLRQLSRYNAPRRTAFEPRPARNEEEAAPDPTGEEARLSTSPSREARPHR